MNSERMVLSLLKRMPEFIIRRMAGLPIEIDGNVLDPNIQLLAKMAGTPEPEADIVAMREGVRKSFLSLDGPLRRGVSKRETHIPGPAGDMRAQIFEPAKTSDRDPAVLFFHQGGLVLMDSETCSSFCSELAAECSAKVISLEYRLCPENKFPAAFDDGMALWDYVQANAASLGIDPHRVALAGDSAGGMISAVLCQELRDTEGAVPAAQLLAYPWVSAHLEPEGSAVSCANCFPLTEDTMIFFNGQVFPDDKHIDHPFANPLLNENLAHLPPAIIATAGFDPIRDQGNEYADRLKAAGTQVTHYCFSSLSHSFLTLGNVSKEAQLAGRQLARDLAKIFRTAK